MEAILFHLEVAQVGIAFETNIQLQKATTSSRQEREVGKDPVVSCTILYSLFSTLLTWWSWPLLAFTNVLANCKCQRVVIVYCFPWYYRHYNIL